MFFFFFCFRTVIIDANNNNDDNVVPKNILLIERTVKNIEKSSTISYHNIPINTNGSCEGIYAAYYIPTRAS